MFRRGALGWACVAVMVALAFPSGAWAAITVVEGQSFTGTVATVGGCVLPSAAVAWGDGMPSSTGTSDGGDGVQGTHTYADEGTYNGVVSYRCSNFGGAQMASFQATVQDAQLSAAGHDTQGTAGQSLGAVVAHFSDANPGASASEFSAQVAWGDGSTSTGLVAVAPGGGFDVSGAHTYTSAGNLSLSTSITDVGGSTATASSTARIAPAPPPAGMAPAPIVGPRIGGEPGHDGTYRCNPGTWTGTPTFAYTWLRRDGGRSKEVTRTPTYRPPSGAIAAALGAGSYYQCLVEARNVFGTASALSRAVLLVPRAKNPLTLLQDPYGDFRIRGIDVLQEVQPNTGATQFQFPSGAFPSLPGGGTPTGLTVGPNGSLVGNKQRATYQGVLLDRTKPTTAIVYVDLNNSFPTNPGQPLEVSLSMVSGNQVVRGPITRTMTNPQRTTSDVVSNLDRANLAYSVRFPIPAGWLLRGRLSDAGTISLRATVRFPSSSRVFALRQCEASGCAENDAYRLDAVRLGPLLSGLIIQTLDLRQQGQPAPPDPTFVLRGARQVMPGGERLRVLPYAGQLNITAAANFVPSQKICKGATTRSCREAIVGAQVIFWSDNNPATQRVGFLHTPFHVYDLLMGVHNYPSGAPGTLEPGWSSSASNLASLPIRGENFTAFGLQPYMAVTYVQRPLTAAAHELGHQLTAPHADLTCGGNSNGQVAEPWSPDNAGRLQGALAVIRPAFAGSPSMLRSVSVDGANGAQLYDLMSYCAPGAASGEKGVGLSARNWDRFFSAQIAYQDRLESAGFARVRSARAASRPALLAVGVLGADGGAITRVGQSLAVPADVPASSLRLRSLAVDGHVLRDAGASVLPLSEQSTQANFSGPVDPGAAAVELVRDGALLDRKPRSLAPRVALQSPHAGQRVRRGRELGVRWRASDPDSKSLDAKVEFSPDAGLSWRTVLDGPDRGAARVPSAYLAGSSRAQVRVTISDGFAEGRSVSGRFRVDARPPRATIQRPVSGETLHAGSAVLLGAGRDDLGRTLRGQSLTWFAGRRRLGQGERLTVKRLAAGHTTLRLVARAASGATATAHIRLRIVTDPPRLLTLSAPRLVGVRTRRIAIHVRAASPAILRAGGHRYHVGPRSRRLSLSLPRAPRHGLLHLGFVLSGPSGHITGALEVVRA